MKTPIKKKKLSTPPRDLSLIRAIRRESFEDFVLALDICDINERDHKGNTPLIKAAKHGRSKYVTLLVIKKCKLDAQDNYGWTALMYAAQRYHSDIVKMLIKYGCNLDIKNSDGYTALEMICKLDYRHEICKLLINGGCNVFATNEYMVYEECCECNDIIIKDRANEVILEVKILMACANKYDNESVLSEIPLDVLKLIFGYIKNVEYTVYDCHGFVVSDDDSAQSYIDTDEELSYDTYCEDDLSSDEY